MQSDPRSVGKSLSAPEPRKKIYQRRLRDSFPSHSRQIMQIIKLDRIVPTLSEHVPKYCSWHKRLLQFLEYIKTQAKVSCCSSLYPTSAYRTFPFSTARFVSDKDAD
jgi:hypothetical protein